MWLLVAAQGATGLGYRIGFEGVHWIMWARIMQKSASLTTVTYDSLSRSSPNSSNTQNLPNTEVAVRIKTRVQGPKLCLGQAELCPNSKAEVSRHDRISLFTRSTARTACCS